MVPTVTNRILVGSALAEQCRRDTVGRFQLEQASPLRSTSHKIRHHQLQKNTWWWQWWFVHSGRCGAHTLAWFLFDRPCRVVQSAVLFCVDNSSTTSVRTLKVVVNRIPWEHLIRVMIGRQTTTLGPDKVCSPPISGLFPNSGIQK